MWATLVLLDKVLPDLSLEDDVMDKAVYVIRQLLAEGFSNKTDGNIRGCIGALDGWSLKLEAPPNSRTLSHFAPWGGRSTTPLGPTFSSLVTTAFA